MYNPPTYLIRYTCISEKDPYRGVVYLTDHPYIVSLLLAVLLFLHFVTFVNAFMTCMTRRIHLTFVGVLYTFKLVRAMKSQENVPHHYDVSTPESMRPLVGAEAF